MCRLFAYLGDELPLGALLIEPEHSLFVQSWKARELVSATVNADGWGAATWLPGDPRPCLYASTFPIWADPNAPHLGRALRSRCMLAAVRSATDPSTVAHANTQPFAAEEIAFVHNGFVDHFRQRVRRKLCAALSDERFAQIAGNTDSEHLFALILEELGPRRGGDALLDAAAAAVERISGWASEAGSRAHFALALADGREVVALRTATDDPPPTLYVRASGSPGTILASEPLDSHPAWRAIPPGRAVRIDASGEVRESNL